MDPSTRTLERVLMAGIERGVGQLALSIRGEAVRNAPVREGDLRGSAAEEPDPVTVSGRTVTGTVAFRREYAAAQHEGEMEYVNPFSGKSVTWKARHWPGGGGPKFLENAVKSHRATTLHIIGSAVRRAVGRA